jgi:hypothetical protein
MPRYKSGPNGWLANIQSDESFMMGYHQELSPKEKSELRSLFESPLFQKALSNARQMKPSAFVTGLDGQQGDKIAANRLHEIRGWKLFEVALSKQAMVPPKKKETPRDNFPDAGRIEEEFKPNT